MTSYKKVIDWQWRTTFVWILLGSSEPLVYFFLNAVLFHQSEVGVSKMHGDLPSFVPVLLMD